MNKFLKMLIYILSALSIISLIFYYGSNGYINLSDIVKIIILISFITIYITIINLSKNINKYKINNNSYIFYLILCLSLIGSVVYGINLNYVYSQLTEYDQYASLTFDSFFINTFESLYFIFLLYLILSFKSKSITIIKR